MRQEQERFRSFDRGGAPDGTPLSADTNPPRGWNPIDTSGAYGLAEASEDRRLREIRFSLRQKNNGDRMEGDTRKTNFPKPDGFVPFLDEEPKEEYVFVNNYGGAYSQKMELNRRGIETVLKKIAHLADGEKVFLTTLAPSRSRAEAQGNELVAKRFLIFGEKPKEVEENPLKRVVSVPEGWRIEINDQRITEELTERELTGEKLQKAFIGRFNTQFRDALKECVWREKFSSIKDRNYRVKLSFSVAYGMIPSLHLWTFPPVEFDLPWSVGGIFIVNVIPNTMFFGLSRDRIRTNIDHPLEFFMPFVEIDKVARTYAYLSGKGRTLVRDAEEKG